MIQAEEGSEEKNISKTSQFVFGQNYKKLVANSKANFDFRKFLQKHSNTKRNFATLGTKDNSKRNPLEDVSTSEFNHQVTLQSKAFKIRCYSKKLAKENDKEDEMSTCKLIKYKPKIYPAKEQKSSKKLISNNAETKKCIRMHKFDNYQELSSISTNIKVTYNDFISESDKITDKAVIFDMPFLTSCVKSSTAKSNEKDRDTEHFRKKSIFFIKKFIEEKYFSQLEGSTERPQIIFKVRKDDEIPELLKSIYECEFGAFYCIFSVQNKHVESTLPYNLMKIDNLAQNVVIFDSIENLTSYPPLIDSRHFIGFSTVSEKSNFGLALETFFCQLENLETYYSAEEFEGEDPLQGQIHEIAYRQLLEKVKQRRNLKDCKKTSREKKQRCHSSYDNNYSINFYENRCDEKTLENFKEKMLKYLKIIGNESGLESKRSKQLKTSSEEELLECFTGREKCSKTNNQLVSELIRLNSHVHKQISSYQRKMEEVELDSTKDEEYKHSHLAFQRVYINNIH